MKYQKAGQIKPGKFQFKEILKSIKNQIVKSKRISLNLFKSLKDYIAGDYLLPFLLLIALSVYLPGINWGIPHATGSDRVHSWANDDLVPLAPLTEMYNTFINSELNQNVAYPWFHYFLVAAFYSPYIIFLYLTGGFHNPSPDFPFGFADPAAAFFTLSLIGRTVSLILALAMVAGIYLCGKYLWNRAVGFLSAFIATLMFPVAYYARLGNLDIPVLAWTSLGLAVFALMLREGVTVKRGILFGAFVALAGATKDQSLGSFVFLVPAILTIHFFRKKTAHSFLSKEFLIGPTAIIMSFVVVYVVASGIPFDPNRYIQHMTKVVMAGTKVIYLRYPPTLAGYSHQALDLFKYLIDVLSLPVLIAAFCGIGLALYKDRASTVIALASVSFFLMLIMVRFSRIHYLLPVALPLTLFAGYAFWWLIDRSHKRIKMISVFIVVGIIGYSLLQTLDLTYAMIHDSRYAAGNWLNDNSQPGDTILYFGPNLRNPHFNRDINTVQVEEKGEAMSAIVNKSPHFILITPDDTNENRLRVEWRYGPHSIYNDYIPEEVYKKLVNQELGYRLVAKFQSKRLFPWIDRPFLSYPTVNPPVHIFARNDRATDQPTIDPWKEAPYYPDFVRVHELTISRLQEIAN